MLRDYCYGILHIPLFTSIIPTLDWSHVNYTQSYNKKKIMSHEILPDSRPQSALKSYTWHAIDRHSKNPTLNNFAKLYKIMYSIAMFDIVLLQSISGSYIPLYIYFLKIRGFSTSVRNKV